MQHGTRKQSCRALSCAFAFGLAAALIVPDSAAFAQVGGGVGGGGDDIDHVDKPFGQIIRIIPERGMSALLFLPKLPVDTYHINEETGQPDLQVLYLDRAYADDPDTWERWGTFTWNSDWQEYACGIDNILPIYDENYQDPSVLYCTVSYSPDTIDYRDFYLQASVVILENGTPKTTVFEPALFAYQDEWLPAPKPEEPNNPDAQPPQPPTVVNPPQVDAGSSGGNRGGVEQGESERIDPISAPDDFTPPIEKAEASPAANPPSAPQADEDGGITQANGNEAADAPAGTDTPHTTASDATSASNANANDEATTSPDRVPGFVWALGITTAAVVVAGGIALVIKGRLTRPHTR